jgi:hypothetical protein
VRFIPGEDYEFVKTPIGIQLHDMPENRPSANFHHGLGAQIRFFGETGTISSGEEYYFHTIYPITWKLSTSSTKESQISNNMALRS